MHFLGVYSREGFISGVWTRKAPLNTPMTYAISHLLFGLYYIGFLRLLVSTSSWHSLCTKHVHSISDHYSPTYLPRMAEHCNFGSDQSPSSILSISAGMYKSVYFASATCVALVRRSFAVVAPSLWRFLPPHAQVFNENCSVRSELTQSLCFELYCQVVCVPSVLCCSRVSGLWTWGHRRRPVLLHDPAACRSERTSG